MDVQSNTNSNWNRNGSASNPTWDFPCWFSTGRNVHFTTEPSSTLAFLAGIIRSAVLHALRTKWRHAVNQSECSGGRMQIQWCPDISPGPVKPDNGISLGVGHKTVLLPLRCIWLKYVHFSHCLPLTVSVIIKRYLCGENALKVTIHYVLWEVFNI